ncbi:MAG: DUF5717 family protein [Lachnospiraceae bacterium]
MKNLKNKIKQFSKGNFQLEKPEILFPETNLVFKIGEGEKYSGSFTIQNQVDGDIRGLVYPSSFRIDCMEQGFEGNPVEIQFTYDSTGLLPGHVEQGKFSVVCNGGEFEITFFAIIEKPFIMTTHGKVQNIEDFKRLAFKDFAEAHKLFRSRDFYEVLRYEKTKILHLYDYMRKCALDESGLEEFLVGIKQKEKIFLTLSSDGREFSELREETKETIVITKNTWGYMKVKVFINGNFIHMNCNEFTTDDFFGSKFDLEYVIEEKKLHKGKNFGQIVLETPYDRYTYDIEVTKDVIKDESRKDEELKFAQFIKNYLSYEVGKIDIQTWADMAERQVNELQDQAPGNDWYKLLQAHIFLLSNRMEEAKWILENYNYSRFAIGKSSELGNYYLFLTAYIKEDHVQIKRIIEEIQKAFLKNNHSWRLVCMLIELDPHYKNSYDKLHMLERQYYDGANHILLYLEAFRCFKKKCSNLKKLGAFETQVLIFATKYKLMTKELALYTANLASQQKGFDNHIYCVLSNSYKMFEEPMILTAVCTMLIKGNLVNNKYFEWYDKSVQSELKISQLYEYYMESISIKKNRGALPRNVYLYFMHGNSLDYEKCAFLYENIINYEDENSELFAHYRNEIEKFAWNQLEKRHINDQLRVIYKRFCTERDLTTERINALNDICYAYEVKTSFSNVKYVLVIEEDGEVHQRVPYTENGALVFLESQEDQIVWEGKNGGYYINSIPYDTKRLFFELRYIDMCKKHMQLLQNPHIQDESEEITFELLRLKGMDAFEEQEILRLCSKQIRENNYEEEDFLTHICFSLFQRDQYDKIILTYLASYYCGATRDMKDIWYIARDYEVNTYKLSERIVTQMLFTEVIFGDAEIFEDYLNGGAYFRLQKAYLAFSCKEYVTRNRILDPKIIQIICDEFEKKEELPDIARIAMLKYYSDKTRGISLRPILKQCMQILCDKQLYFPFYMKYDEGWLREFQLWDKTMVSYIAAPDTKVKISYQLQKSSDIVVEFQTEELIPMYENIYVKIFILFEDEILKYSFKEIKDEKIIRSQKQNIRRLDNKNHVGKYGKLNQIIKKSGYEHEQIIEYAVEDEMAKRMFILYE